MNGPESFDEWFPVSLLYTLRVRSASTCLQSMGAMKKKGPDLKSRPTTKIEYYEENRKNKLKQNQKPP